MWSSWWEENWQGKSKYSTETLPNATLSTPNPISPVAWAILRGSN